MYNSIRIFNGIGFWQDQEIRKKGQGKGEKKDSTMKKKTASHPLSNAPLLI